jgi:hypothetical protein
VGHDMDVGRDADHDVDNAQNKYHEDASSEELGHDEEHEPNHPGKSKDRNNNEEEHEEPELPNEHHEEPEEEHGVAVKKMINHHQQHMHQHQHEHCIPGSAQFEAATSRTGAGLTKTAYVKDFAKMVDESSATPCMTTIFTYNSATFERTWCNTQKAPLTAVKLAGDCDRSASDNKNQPTCFLPTFHPFQDKACRPSSSNGTTMLSLWIPPKISRTSNATFLANTRKRHGRHDTGD